jgi:hypothetical protein
MLQTARIFRLLHTFHQLNDSEKSLCLDVMNALAQLKKPGELTYELSGDVRNAFQEVVSKGLLEQFGCALPTPTAPPIPALDSYDVFDSRDWHAAGIMDRMLDEFCTCLDGGERLCVSEMFRRMLEPLNEKDRARSATC